MKQTNYHLFDFMDFSDRWSECGAANDPSLQKDEALWKAYAPTKIQERDGDIVVTIPYQKQLHQEDMAPDLETPQQTYDLVVRAYEPNIIRLFTTMTDDQMTDNDEMLQFAPEIKRMSLHLLTTPSSTIGATCYLLHSQHPSSPSILMVTKPRVSL